MPDADAIVQTVAEEYGFTVADLKGRDRHADIVEARVVAMQMLFLQGLGVTQIGEVLNRDHSTVSKHLGANGVCPLR